MNDCTINICCKILLLYTQFCQSAEKKNKLSGNTSSTNNKIIIVWKYPNTNFDNQYPNLMTVFNIDASNFKPNPND